MLKTQKSQKSTSSEKNLPYSKAEEKILLRVVLPLRNAGLTDQEIATQLKIGVKHIRQLIQQAQEKEAPRGSQVIRERIQQAMTDLQAQGAFPDDRVARRQALNDYGIQQTALTKHADLWYPDLLPRSHRDAWNQKQTESARERIQQAVADLRMKGALPEKCTARFNQLTQYKIGGSTLYKHRDLWDPEYDQALQTIDVAS